MCKNVLWVGLFNGLDSMLVCSELYHATGIGNIYIYISLIAQI